MEESLYGILTASANEVANGVAEHVAKDTDTFVNMMNEKARELGCKNTHFVNAHGLYHEEHYTTAYDLALIAQAFFQHDRLSKIGNTASYHFHPTATQPDDFIVRNKHKLITGEIEYEGIEGGKTGYTDEARQTLVTCAEQNGMKLICVVMKEESPDQFYDTVTLLDYGFLIAAIYMVGKTSENFLLSNKKFLICISVAIFSAVVMTASRAGFLCFALPLLFIFLSKRIKWYWFFLGIAFVIGVSYFLYSKGTFDVLLYRFFEQGNIESGGERTDIWDRGLSNFFNQDFINILFGGGYWHRATLTHGADLHNEFLSVLLDYGLFGLILFLSVIFSNLTFKFKDFFYKNLPVIFFVLTLLSLSPFQSIYVCFLIIWIYSYKDFMSISKYKV
jgi:hypothetical protein